MHYSTALNTSPLCRYYTRTSLLITEVPGQRGSINSFICCVLWRCPLNSLLERSWRHLCGPRLCNITDLLYIINLRLDAPHQKFLRTTEWGPAKRVSNRVPHLLTPALLIVKPNIASFQNTWEAIIGWKGTAEYRTKDTSVQSFETNVPRFENFQNYKSQGWKYLAWNTRLPLKTWRK